MVLPNHVALLLDGEIKKRQDIPARTLERIRALRTDALKRAPEAQRRRRS
jgi:hypothetical protein